MDIKEIMRLSIEAKERDGEGYHAECRAPVNLVVWQVVYGTLAFVVFFVLAFAIGGLLFRWLDL